MGQFDYPERSPEDIANQLRREVSDLQAGLEEAEHEIDAWKRRALASEGKAASVDCSRREIDRLREKLALSEERAERGWASSTAGAQTAAQCTGEGAAGGAGRRRQRPIGNSRREGRRHVRKKLAEDVLLVRWKNCRSAWVGARNEWDLAAGDHHKPDSISRLVPKAKLDALQKKILADYEAMTLRVSQQILEQVTKEAAVCGRVVRLGLRIFQRCTLPVNHRGDCDAPDSPSTMRQWP